MRAYYEGGEEDVELGERGEVKEIFSYEDDVKDNDLSYSNEIETLNDEFTEEICSGQDTNCNEFGFQF